MLKHQSYPAMRVIGIALLSVTLLNSQRIHAAESITLHAMVERIVNTYPSIDIAVMQVEVARQEFAKVKSSLGWQMYTNAGVARDLSIINATTDRFDVNAGLQRRLQSGSQLEIAGSYLYEDSAAAFSPLLPNPSRRSGLDIRYRMPLARGDGNALYYEGLANAEANLQLEKSSQIQAIDNLVQNSANIFFDAANAYQRLEDAKSAVERAKRLKTYIQRNFSLGLAEDKDMLGIDAQITGAISRRDGIEVTWKALSIELNRLMGYPSGTQLRLITSPVRDFDRENRELLLQAIYVRNPVLSIQEALASIALANINITEDQRKEQLDLVLSAGARYGSGDTATGSYSQDEIIGAARLEYRFDLDQQGFDAEYYQNLLRYEAAKKEQDLVRYDIRYALDNLIEQLILGRATVLSHEKHVNQEKRKLEEALNRYREGRATTTDVINFENDLNLSLFSYNTQKIELARVQANILILLGELWDSSLVDKVRTPDMTHRRAQ